MRLQKDVTWKGAGRCRFTSINVKNVEIPSSSCFGVRNYRACPKCGATGEDLEKLLSAPGKRTPEKQRAEFGVDARWDPDPVAAVAPAPGVILEKGMIGLRSVSAFVGRSAAGNGFGPGPGGSGALDVRIELQVRSCDLSRGRHAGTAVAVALSGAGKRGRENSVGQLFNP